MSHTAPDQDPLDHGNATDVQVSMGNVSSGASKDKPPADSAPNDLNFGSSRYENRNLKIHFFLMRRSDQTTNLMIRIRKSRKMMMMVILSRLRSLLSCLTSRHWNHFDLV